MNNRNPALRRGLIALLSATLTPATAVAAAANQTGAADGAIETMNVREARLLDSARLELAGRELSGPPDVARALARSNGVEANENGPLSSQLQVRGLYGHAVGVRLEGLHVLSGGPNWMDPPLYVAPAGMLESVSLVRAPAGVADGAGPGAQTDLRWKRPQFSEAQRAEGGARGWRPWLDLDTGASSVDDGTALAAALGIASADQRLHIAASREQGDDYDTPQGRVRPSQYDREAFALGYGRRYERGEIDIGWRRIESDEGGTPSLPMDIRFIDTEMFAVDWKHRFDTALLQVVAGRSRVEHGMGNSFLRPTPDFSQSPLPPFAGDDARAVLADVEGRELAATLTLPLVGGELRGGGGWRDERHDADVFDPDFPPFFLNNFAAARLEIATAFLEWEGAVSERTRVSAGARIVDTHADADEVDAFPATLVDANPAAWPMGTGPRGNWVLRERFNDSDRSRSDLELDWALALSHGLSERLTAEVAVARRSRAPSYNERFLWVPLESTSGLADGNTYVGRPDLQPEISHQVELALHYRGDGIEGSLRGHWREIDGAILGTLSTDPVVIGASAGGSGDPTPLQFDNVDARIRGIEADARAWLRSDLWLEAGITWLEGERTEGPRDPLWRIAPPNARLSLTWDGAWGRYRITQELVARGDELSRIQLDDPANPSNEFTETAGYGLTHLYADWTPRAGVQFSLGVENLFDREHVSPLAGFNRAEGNVVAVGERLPGRGRNLYARLSYRLD